MALTKTGWGDNTQGTQKLMAGMHGINVEFHAMDITNEVSASNEVPTTLTRLLGFVGQACCSDGCVSGTQGKPITAASICVAGALDISVGDFSTGGDSAELYCVAWGY